MDETWPSTAAEEATSDASTHGVAPEEHVSHRRIRFAVWGVAVVVFAGFLSLLRVHTYLGVEAEVWDKHGRDYVWSIWWRARHDMIGAVPSGLFVVLYIGLIVAFLALAIFAVWLALVPDEQLVDSDLCLPAEVSTQ